LVVLALVALAVGARAQPQDALGGGVTGTPTRSTSITPTPPTPVEPYTIVMFASGHAPSPPVQGQKVTWTFWLENSPIPPCCAGISPPVTIQVTLTGQTDAKLSFNLNGLPEGYPTYIYASSGVTAPPGSNITAAAVAYVEGQVIAGAAQQDTVGPDPGDLDSDGCSNEAEIQPKAMASSGGGRDPNKFWDFFDTPDMDNTRDRAIGAADILRVVLRFGTMGNAGVNPLSAPPPSGYHTAFDRAPPAPGSNPWNTNAPDGSISVGDIMAAVQQFGHSCA
jgi:hypothetical protein